ncbi:MAG: dihydrodipicolinate synthase family protein, partial [Chitinispirillaceae bacterium]|nr:dihydrodipicolinate synthase family protein [Chitinispirillaceae bacterium]
MSHKSQTIHIHFHSTKSAENIVANFIEDYFRKISTPVLIAIGGPGGSGKTLFADKLRRKLKESDVIHLDNYKKTRAEREKRNLSGPHPDANRMELIKQHLQAIKRGEKIKIPVYDLTTGDIGSYLDYSPVKFNIVEGEVSTYRDFRTFIDLSIFIDSDFKTQLSARIGRDVEIRGHSIQKAIKTFLMSNLNEFTKYGAESKQWADITLFCHEDYHFTIESVKKDLFDKFQSIIKNIAPIEPSGLIVPITTPFEKDLSICETAFIEHLSYLKQKGVTKIIIGGTTAEFFSLTLKERLSLLKISREYFPGFIIFNISCDSLPSTIKMAEEAHRYGIDALICLPPYYYAGAPESGLIEFFLRVKDSSPLPFYLYNFPKHTGNPITCSLLRNISHDGLKDSAGELSLINFTPKYLLGGDSKIVEVYKKGGCGFVPGLPNAFPEIYLKLENLLDKKDFEKAELLQKEINTFKGSLPKVSGVVIVKKFLNAIIED